MEINKLNEVNPDDLDVIFRGIQLFIDQKENDLETTIPQLVDKYKYYQLQDHDKKLFHRFQIRVSELIEKCKNQSAINYVLSIRDILNYKAQNFAVILNKVLKRCEMQATQQNEDNPQIQMKRSVPSWQLNSQQNRTLFQFYDNDFWKLYDIMLLNKQHCSNLIVYHQSKLENVERLFASSLERNQRFLQYKSLPIIEITTLTDKARKLKFLQLTQTMETPYANKNITMFGNQNQNQNQSPTKKTQVTVKHSISISPQRTQSKDPQDQDIRSMFDTENFNLFDTNYKITRAKNLSLHNDKIIAVSVQNKQKGKSKLQQENFSPQKGCKNQNWMLPEIKSPFYIDQNDSLIKPIQIPQNYVYTQSPERRSAKKPPLASDLNSTLCQQLLPQYRNNTRAFQTIKSFIRK
ncbi:unnamed protein product (macronuclear) [Paramecium tetraurelia]|uniref:Uncharacterized protein n=1 Tax=Paramecium tetraurelia TaxID=5888 RepID=A0CI97_PARTE|nr:uncharacterized protein GSPATT00007649001 [Paramecium tetraurelia]CAK70514.1 unnamed protein product [Paramecium tetraurelia]|eukprot:XP_001437911.1 hypothetical protein (macronuclear) [Paramecium tetraurelia strain d4-2]